jgi:hypothetical protein
MKCANYYKIGHSKNPSNRRATIQTHNPLDVKICALYKTMDALLYEKQLHALFYDKRSRGEWFELTEADLIDLKVNHGFDFKIDISKIYKEDFENTTSESETKKYRINNFSLTSAVNHFEELFSCTINDPVKIKKVCLKYDLDLIMKCITDLFEREYCCDVAYNKLQSFCKYEHEKRTDPVSYLAGIVQSIYKNHYKIELEENDLYNLNLLLAGIQNVDEFLKKINSQKYYKDYQEFWDMMCTSVIVKSNKNY